MTKLPVAFIFIKRLVKNMEKQEARQRILDASLKIFSEKGFEGARMDAIAIKAGVNKALIYYYFKNKRDLLDRLIGDFLRDSKELFVALMGEFDFSDKSAYEGIFQRTFLYLEQHEQIIRLIMLETLKKGSSRDDLYDFVIFYLGEDRQTFNEMVGQVGMEVPPDIDMEMIRVTEFFTMIGPLLLYILLRDDWSRYFKLEKENLNRMFIRAMEETHVQQHL